jgi:hypothetical protein
MPAIGRGILSSLVPHWSFPRLPMAHPSSRFTYSTRLLGQLFAWRMSFASMLLSSIGDPVVVGMLRFSVSRIIICCTAVFDGPPVSWADCSILYFSWWILSTMLVYPRAPYFVLPYISCAGSVRLEFVSCLIVRSSGLKRFSYSWRTCLRWQGQVAIGRLHPALQPSSTLV